MDFYYFELCSQLGKYTEVIEKIKRGDYYFSSSEKEHVIELIDDLSLTIYRDNYEDESYSNCNKDLKCCQDIKQHLMNKH